MQQHPSNVNVQGQPPEKKLRVSGNYTAGDPTNYEYQVNRKICFCFYFLFFIVEKSESTNVSTTTATFLVCSFIYKYIIYLLVHSLFNTICT